MEQLELPRYGKWMQTFSGKRFYPLDPHIEDITVDDMIHAISLENRFGGHTVFPYSVGAHCYWVSTLVPDHLALPALVHDWAEAYLKDIPSPLKELFPGYYEAEERLERLIAQVVGVSYEDMQHPLVKQADRNILANERRDVMTRTDDVWHTIGDNQPYPNLFIHAWSWEWTKELLLHRYGELGGKYGA